MRKWKQREVPKGFNLEGVLLMGAGGETNLRKTFDGFENFFAKYGLRKDVVADIRFMCVLIYL